MPNKKTKGAESKAPKKGTKADLQKKLEDAYPSASGVALKKSTVANAGVYPVVLKETGTSAITRLAVYTAVAKKVVKKPTDKVKAEDLINILKAPEFVPVSGLAENIIGRPYGNFNTLKSRLSKEVNEGRIGAFKIDFDPTEDFKAVLPKITKLLK